MNKRSITQCVLNMALDYASQMQAQRITGVCLVTGEHSEATCEALRRHWDDLAHGTLAEGSTLHMTYAPFMLKCSECGHTFELRDSAVRCPTCGSHAVAIIGGDGCRLEAIQYE